MAHVDCIGQFTVNVKDTSNKDNTITILALTMINPATGWFETGCIPEDEDDFNSQKMLQLMSQMWFPQYSCPVKYTFHNNNEF